MREMEGQAVNRAVQVFRVVATSVALSPVGGMPVAIRAAVGTLVVEMRAHWMVAGATPVGVTSA